MKNIAKKDAGVSPVIAVILMVAITVVLAGVVFLWAQSFTDESNSSVETVNVRGSLDDSTDVLSLEVISGTYTWANYRVTADGTALTVSSGASSSAGATATFTGGAYTSGTSYNVKIVNIAEDKVVWEDDIIAVA